MTSRRVSLETRSFIDRQTGQVGTRTSCATCGEDGIVTGSKHLPLDVFIQKLARQGWSFSGRAPIKPICPECFMTAPKAATTKQPSPLDPRQLRQAMGLLEQYFDDAAGSYGAGRSDRLIAEEVGVAAAAITALREEAFGPIRADPEVEAIRKDVVDIKTLLAEVDKRLDRLDQARKAPKGAA